MTSPHNAGQGAWGADELDAAERARIAPVLAALAQPRLGVELASQDEAVAQMIGRMRVSERRPPQYTLPEVRGGRSLRLAVAVAAAFAATSGAAFAGVLPAPAQDVASRALSAVGVHVPDGHGSRSGGHDGTPTAPQHGRAGPAHSPGGHDATAHVRIRVASHAGQAGDGHGKAGAAHGHAAGHPSHERGTPAANPRNAHAGEHPTHPSHPPTGPGNGGGSQSSGSGHPRGGGGAGGASSSGHAGGGGNRHSAG